MSKGTCTLDGCEKPRKYRLYCSMHQRRYRATGDPGVAGDLRMSREGQCSVDECTSPIRSKGMCRTHYARLLRLGSVDLPVREVSWCSVSECHRPAYAREMCEKHYERWRRNGSTDLPQRQKDMLCPVEGCPHNRRHGGYCQNHARRAAKYGDPLAPTPLRPPADPVALFWSRVTPGGADECWPWEGVVSTQGYGVYSIRGVQYKAHRLACSIGMGREIASDKMACHRCNNPICVNPRHLYEGDGDSNADDMVVAGNSMRGTRNVHNRLTPAQVQEIRLLSGSRSAREVADAYGVVPSSIRHIWKGTNWAWLPWPGECADADREARRR